MSFDQYLEHFERNTPQREKVALAIYFLENERGQTTVSRSDVRDLIRPSRSSISPSSVSPYFRRLENNDGWITDTGNGGYRLTSHGEGEVEARLDESVQRSAREEGDRFLDLSGFEERDQRYEKLVEDINSSYRYRIYDATMVLTRKLFEDLVFQILLHHYAGEDDMMYYDQDNEEHYSFDKLLTNLKDGVPEVRMYSRELDQSMVEEIRDLKEEGNTGAHSIRVDFSDEEVEDWSSEATRFAETLYAILRGIRMRNERQRSS